MTQASVTGSGAPAPARASDSATASLNVFSSHSSKCRLGTPTVSTSPSSLKTVWPANQS